MNIEYFHVRKRLYYSAKLFFFFVFLLCFLINRSVSLVHWVGHDTFLLSNLKSLLSLGFLYSSMSTGCFEMETGIYFVIMPIVSFYSPDSLTVYLYWVLESKYKELHSIKNFDFHAFHFKILYHFNLMLNCTTPFLHIYRSEFVIL